MATPTPEQVIRGYNNAVFEVRTRVENFARVAWSSAGSWREADVDRLVAQIVPKVQAGQIRTAQLTAAYLASLQTIRSGARVAAVAVDRELVVAARGVAAEDIYRRPAATMYASLSKGASLTTAVGAGLNRLQSLVATDHQLAKTAQARRSLGRGGFQYMRRTLTGRENCALCAIASTQRYRVQDLLPIHPGCDCGIDTVRSNTDPGQVLDPAALELIHSAVEGEFGTSQRAARYIDGRNDRSDYLDLIAVRQHGELGPVLTWRDQHFTSKDDLPAYDSAP